MKLSQWFNLLKTFSHDVGIIQCSVNGLIHENICLQFQKLTPHPVHGLIHEGTRYKLSRWLICGKFFMYVGIIQ